MLRNFRAFLVLGALGVFASSVALAQSEGYVEALEALKDAGALLLDRKRASFNPLIKLRTDFNDEMDRSVDQIK